MHNPHEMGEKKIGRLLWDFSLPAITGMMVNGLYNIVDSIFVGHGVGAIGLAAVTVAFPVMIILMAFSMLIGVGATTLISIRMGEHKIQEAEKILGTALLLGMVSSLVLTTGFELFLEPILANLGAEAAVLPYARDFTHVILLGNIFMFLGFGLNNVIRAEGHPRIAMQTMIISAVLNTLLNPLFIFILGLGIKGSALATVISQAVSALLVLRHFRGENSFLKLRLCNIRLSKLIIPKILAMGSSVFFMQLAASVVTGLLNFSLQIYGGQLAVAAMGIVNRISLLMLMPIFGINQGVQPIIGYNYGARNYSRVIETLNKGMMAATVISVSGFLLVELFDTYIVRLFNNEPELIVIGAEGLRLSLCMLPVVGFQIVGSVLFQAIGKPYHSLLLSMSRQVILLIPLVLILPRFWGVTGIWLASPLADLGAAILTGILVWNQIRQLKPAEVKQS
ncbi:MAG: MATE family efflux transporter [Veillonellales bacterium]